jgi:hypothetical protein
MRKKLGLGLSIVAAFAVMYQVKTGPIASDRSPSVLMKEFPTPGKTTAKIIQIATKVAEKFEGAPQLERVMSEEELAEFAERIDSAILSLQELTDEINQYKDRNGAAASLLNQYELQKKKLLAYHQQYLKQVGQQMLKLQNGGTI